MECVLISGNQRSGIFVSLVFAHFFPVSALPGILAENGAFFG
jgi:hypothetical protein